MWTQPLYGNGEAGPENEMQSLEEEYHYFRENRLHNSYINCFEYVTSNGYYYRTGTLYKLLPLVEISLHLIFSLQETKTTDLIHIIYFY